MLRSQTQMLPLVNLLRKNRDGNTRSKFEIQAGVRVKEAVRALLILDLTGR